MMYLLVMLTSSSFVAGVVLLANVCTRSKMSRENVRNDCAAWTA